MRVSSIAITGGKIIDGTGVDPLEVGVVLVEDECIAAVGAVGEVAVPEDVQVIDASGMTVMPGVIDCHQHVGTGYAPIKRLQESLRRGVTTLAQVTGGPEAAKLRDAIESGIVGGCARYHVGMVVSCTFGHLRRADGNVEGVLADGPWEVRRGVRQMVQAGADFIKTSASGGFQWGDEALTFRNYTLEELQALVDEAHAWHRRVMVHAHIQPGINNSIEAGCDSIHHCALIDDEGLQRLADSGLWYVPTLHITSEASYNNEHWKRSMPHMTDRMEQASPIHREGVRKAHEMGIPMAVGTDGKAGDAMHEMMEMVTCGLSPMDTIVAGTLNAARVLGIDEMTGTLHAGKKADIIVVDGDPLADISVLYDETKIVVAMRDGTREMMGQGFAVR